MIYTRRKFLKKLGVLFAVVPVWGLSRIKKQKGFKLCTLKVAGLQYGDMSKHTFIPTQKLSFIREKDNLYDAYAVAIYFDKRKVGYIPRTNSRIIASLLDNGIKLNVNVRYFDKYKEVWDRLWVEVWQV